MFDLISQHPIISLTALMVICLTLETIVKGKLTIVAYQNPDCLDQIVSTEVKKTNGYLSKHCTTPLYRRD